MPLGRGSARVLAAMRRTDVQLVALTLEHAEHLRWLIAGAAEPVWCSGVELGHLAEDNVVVAEDLTSRIRPDRT